MDIRVTTAIEGCEETCSHLSIQVTELYRDGDKIKRSYKCKNMENCLSMLREVIQAWKKTEQ